MPSPGSLRVNRPLSILDLMVLTAALALPMAAVSLVADHPTWGFGRSRVDGVGVVLSLLAAGFVLWGIAELAARAGDGWLSLLALASMAVGGVGFLGVGVLAFLFHPYAAVLTLGSQMFMIHYVAFRP